MSEVRICTAFRVNSPGWTGRMRASCAAFSASLHARYSAAVIFEKSGRAGFSAGMGAGCEEGETRGVGEGEMVAEVTGAVVKDCLITAGLVGGGSARK